MNKKELLFYDAYEAFYAMAKESKAFQSFCKDAFGEDFSQDGFSNKEQIDLILQYIPNNGDVHILDIGCGNGKMLGYLQKMTNACIHGFDYSGEAIRTAQKLFRENAEFREGIIGQIEYPEEKFDVIVSMDTLYFAADLTAFVAQVKKWLKTDGVFFVGYQEGDVMPKTTDAHTTLLAQALKANDMAYKVTDISQQTYFLLKAKREAAMRHQAMFEEEGHRQGSFKEWLKFMMDEEAEFGEKMILERGKHSIDTLRLYKTLEKRLNDVREDENAVILFPYPMVLDLQGDGGFNFLHICSDCLSAVFDELTRKDIVAGRKIFVIYPSADNKMVLRCMNNNKREYILAPEMNEVFSYSFFIK